MSAIKPTLGLLSALGSFAAAVYYARLIGASPVRHVRDPRSVPINLMFILRSPSPGKTHDPGGI